MSATVEPKFEHVVVPGRGVPATLLMLHGTGGNEHDLVPLAERILPGAAVLSPRGQVLEHGMPRFFRRIAEGVFDVADLEARADALAAWIAQQVRERSLPQAVYAVGYSNGANIASAVLLRNPGILAGAVLLRAMVPFEPAQPVAVAPVLPVVLISQGAQDPLVTRAQGERLADILRAAHAEVHIVWQNAAHGLVAGDLDAATAFLAQVTER